MDILLSTFVKKHINKLNIKQLQELEDFLKFEDEVILNFYNFNITKSLFNNIKYSSTLNAISFRFSPNTLSNLIAEKSRNGYNNYH